MEVTHLTDQITHAVIGGAKAIDFGMSDSPEMMHTFSSSLYTDQILAVVRETLCNAWDAHIEANCTDRPIEITLEAEKLVIRDFGPGIHRDMIGPIYGTYGGTTKRKNGNVTGGFGLGCKAPFAYGDHFEVTSMHKHEKTIYQLSKSNAEVGGKPSILPIMTIPTTESGIQVSLDIKRSDHARFIELIKRIIYNGEIHAKLNGNVIPTFPFSEADSNFLITHHKLIDTNERILLRYGNVIYPVQTHELIGKEYNAIVEIIGKLSPNRWDSVGNYKIVFQAPANSISVTPSREALSMQSHTVATLKDIFTTWLKNTKGKIRNKSYEYLKERVDAVYLDGRPASLLYCTASLPNQGKTTNLEIIHNLDEMVGPYLTREYPSQKGFDKTNMKHRFMTLLKGQFGDRNAIIALHREYRKDSKLDSYRTPYRTNWYGKFILNPIREAIGDHKDLSMDKLFVYGRYGKDRYRNKIEGFIEATKLPRKDIEEYLPFLRKFVILSYNRIGVTDRAPHHPAIKHWFGEVKESLIYITPRVPRKVEEARELFTKLGYYIVDLTKNMKDEDETVVEPVTRVLSNKPKKVGIPTLGSILNAAGHVETSRAQASDLARIEKPEFVFKFAGKTDQNNLEGLTNTATKDIIHLWGDIGGIIVNSNQEAKYVAQGAKTFSDFAYEKVLEQFKTNDRIRAYMPFDYTRHSQLQGYKYRFQQDVINLFEAVYADKLLMSYFGIINELTQDDKAYLNLYKELKENFYTNNPITGEIDKELKQLAINPIINILMDKFEGGHLMKCLNASWVNTIMLGKYPEKQKELVRDMLLECIEG